MKSSLSKRCRCSTENITHSELTEFDELPKFLFIVVNRYAFNSRSHKNDALISINKEFLINGFTYCHLATIYHLGLHTSSGHYTTKLSYADAAYICDDTRVSTCNIMDDENSNSCYMILFVREDQSG